MFGEGTGFVTVPPSEGVSVVVLSNVALVPPIIVVTEAVTLPPPQGSVRAGEESNEAGPLLEHVVMHPGHSKPQVTGFVTHVPSTVQPKVSGGAGHVGQLGSWGGTHVQPPVVEEAAELRAEEDEELPPETHDP